MEQKEITSTPEKDIKPRKHYTPTPLQIVLSLLIILFIVVLSVRNSYHSSSPDIRELGGTTMGTFYEVKIVNNYPSTSQPDFKHIKSEIDKVLAHINGQMSTYIEDSELSQFNRYNGTGWFEASEDLVSVIAHSLVISEKSGGAFDITVGPLVNLWGFGPVERTGNPIPDEDDIKEARGAVGFEKLSVRRIPAAIKKDVGTVYVDLSAIAKGFAVDKISEYLDAAGITDYLVEIGGEIRTKGKNHLKEPWQVGISTSDGTLGIQKVVSLAGQSIATSGDYRNYFEKEGVRYSHTIDPQTGKPVTHSLASVTVVHDNCMSADALATAIMVLGPEKGFSFALREHLSIFMIIKEGETFTEKMTPAFKQILSEKEVAI
jgi:thiamine biosynthesis lipoprotein